ncbi:class I SAM-dependent methyltransferase [Effusibacillus pohliae]|uniref:class I SAM-dependent methyltransferase n=1 Tax=Effusibacillus pohliae TaxID=232270 RepID=UPI00035CBB47|nr:class I SAM-dependent methyltransferase [Effusibacillus pohliae]
MDYIKRTKQRYDQLARSHEWRHTELTPGLVVRFTTMLLGDKVLDLGSGAGRDTLTLKRYGVHVQGLDISEEMLAIAQKTVNDVPFRKGDFRNLPYPDDMFDGIWANLSLLHLMKQDLPVALSQVRRVLKDTGVLYASFLTEGEDGFIDDLYYAFYKPEELHRIFDESGFAVFDEVANRDTMHLFARKK